MKEKSFFTRYKLFTFFLVLALGIILIAVCAPAVTGGISPLDGDICHSLQAPGRDHIFGTDKMGRDIFARVIYGARVSLVAAFSVVGLSFIIGMVLGLLSGFFRGWLDNVLMRIADMMLSFPGLVLAMAVAGIMGASVKNAVIAVALVTWPKYARLARSLALKIRDRAYISAAIVTGSKNLHILLKYMVPNALPLLIITAATDIGSLMLELAGLSFLGFGATPPTPEWGLMLSEGRSYMQTAPWLMLFPGLAIFITVVVFNMLGDCLRDVLDPRDEK